MAKKRKQVCVSESTHERLRLASEGTGIKIQSLADKLLNEVLDQRDAVIRDAKEQHAEVTP